MAKQEIVEVSKEDISKIVASVLEELEPISPWMTVKETANHLRLGETKTRHLIRTGEIPHKRIGGNSIRVNRKMLDQSIILDRNVELKAPTQRESKRLKKLLN